MANCSGGDQPNAQQSTKTKKRKDALKLLGTTGGPSSEPLTSSPTLNLSNTRHPRSEVIRHVGPIKDQWQNHALHSDRNATSKAATFPEEQKEEFAQAVEKKYEGADWTEETKKVIDQEALSHAHYSAEDEGALKILDNFLNDQRYEKEGYTYKRNYFLNFYFTPLEGIPIFNVKPACFPRHKAGHDIAEESDGEAKAGGFKELVHFYLKFWAGHEAYHRCHSGPRAEIKAGKIPQKGEGV